VSILIGCCSISQLVVAAGGTGEFFSLTLQEFSGVVSAAVQADESSRTCSWPLWIRYPRLRNSLRRLQRLRGQMASVLPPYLLE